VEHEREKGPWPMINIIGPNGVGKAALAGSLCERMKLQLCRLDISRLIAPGTDRSSIYPLLEREAALSQFALYVDTTAIHEPGSAAASAVGEIAEQFGGFLIVAGRDRWRSERRTLAVEVSRPNAEGQKALWQKALARVPHELNGEVDAL